MMNSIYNETKVDKIAINSKTLHYMKTITVKRYFNINEESKYVIFVMKSVL